MVRSIRWRLQLWYALVLTAVVVGFAGILYFRVRDARHREVDSDLILSAGHLDSVLRTFPGDTLPNDHPPQRPPLPEERLAGLDLPDRWPPRPRGPRGAPPPPPPLREERFFVVWLANGSVLKSTWPEAEPPLPEESGSPDRPHVRHRRGWWELTRPGPHGTIILVGRSVRQLDADLTMFFWQLLAAGAVVLAVGLAGGWLIASRILRPVAVIADTASRISATNLSERIDTSRIDSELADLARVLNAAFDRLESAVDHQVQFTADASHELRTPLAVVRTQAELALMRVRPAEDYREALGHCQRAAVRMSSIVEALLVLARADSSSMEMRREPLALALLLEDAISLVEPLARERGISIESDLADVVIDSDPETLARIASTLLSNAVQYNVAGGRVWVRLKVETREVVLSVRDTGVGIAAEDCPHIFERFYRVDKARSRESGGTGLGLAICKAMVEALGGSVTVESALGVGSTFQVRLPHTPGQGSVR